ncbi:MAG: hypothetical protein LBS07_05915, partial [Prevotellaceae bacterium]|nr:hypothetical protein [Prevotellaceae bacterium]
MKISKESLQLLIKASMFLLLAITIIQLYPNKKSFNYHFETGKPWVYEILTAPFDFPIYKSTQQIDAEREKLLDKFTPYYLMDSSALVTLNQTLSIESDSVRQQVKNYLTYKFKILYQDGIISVEDYQNLLKTNKKEINCIMPGRLTRVIPVDKLHTPKTAYEEIFHGASWMKEYLKSYDLNACLIENLKYDSLTSELSKKE